jgi:oligoendopeptidase F
MVKSILFNKLQNSGESGKNFARTFTKINERRLKDKKELNHLYTELITKRDTIAKNAGFKNYRDYKFIDLGRFDYSKEECFQFHEAVKQHVLPLVNEINQRKKEKLGLETLRPWDVEAEPENIQPLRPFETGEELLGKSIAVFEKLRPFFADCLRKMKAMNRLDLDSRKGKAPGGYNCPLAETGAPFILYECCRSNA